MRVTPMAHVLLMYGLAACARHSEEAQETTRVATDTLVERRQVEDTLLVKNKTNVATDTTIAADTTIVADTSVTADTTMAADTSKMGGGVISVDTMRLDSTKADTSKQQ
jgi:hypothetical protein